MPAKLTNKIVDERLENRPIIRLDDYVDSKTKISWGCIDCGNDWEARPNGILHGRGGCPSCACNARKTPGQYILEIKDKPLTALEPYITNNTKIKHQCKICGNIWSVVPRSILQGVGCPDCSREKKTKTPEQYISDIKHRSLTALEPYINDRTKIKHQCNICDNIWNVAPYSILKCNGCPACGKVARQVYWEGQSSEPLKLRAREIPCSLYIAEHKDCYKVGISSNVNRRIKELNREGFKCVLDKEFPSNTWDAIMLEAKIRNMFPAYDLPVKFSGHTELYHREDLQQIEKIINGN